MRAAGLSPFGAAAANRSNVEAGLLSLKADHHLLAIFLTGLALAALFLCDFAALVLSKSCLP
jgi:hypothetical protein